MRSLAEFLLARIAEDEDAARRISGRSLAEFLLARIAEDEDAARRISGRRWYACDDGCIEEEQKGSDIWNPPPWTLPNHHNSWAVILDAARVSAECEAKRRIVEFAPWADNSHHAALRDTPGRWILRLLALPYADHPDYREEWQA